MNGDLALARNEISKWLEHLGMSSERSWVVLHTDSEHALVIWFQEFLHDSILLRGEQALNCTDLWVLLSGA